MTNTREERIAMGDKLQECGYPIIWIVYIIDEVVDFYKETKGLTHEEKIEKIRKHRWIAFMRDSDVRHVFPSTNAEEVKA